MSGACSRGRSGRKKSYYGQPKAKERERWALRWPCRGYPPACGPLSEIKALAHLPNRHLYDPKGGEGAVALSPESTQHQLGEQVLLLLLDSHGHIRTGVVGRATMRSCSEQEGDNGHAQGWVVTKLLQVAAMLALGPDSHLGEAHQGEEGHCGQNGVSRVVPRCKGRAPQAAGDSPGTHCVMMAKPIQEPTCGQHKRGLGHRPSITCTPEKEGSTSPSSNCTVPHPHVPACRKKAGPHLVRVVGAGHQQKQPGEGVLGRVWDLPGFGPWCVRQE